MHRLFFCICCKRSNKLNIDNGSPTPKVASTFSCKKSLRHAYHERKCYKNIPNSTYVYLLRTDKIVNWNTLDFFLSLWNEDTVSS